MAIFFKKASKESIENKEEYKKRKLKENLKVREAVLFQEQFVRDTNAINAKDS